MNSSNRYVSRRALVVGDSFIKRLKDYRINVMHSSDYNVHGTYVEIQGYPGIDIQGLQSNIRYSSCFRYHVVIINCGSNDLCKRNHTPEWLVNQLLSLATFLIQSRTVQKVVIVQLLERLKVHYRHFEISLAEYNARVRATNYLLSTVCTDSVHYWKHDYSVLKKSCICHDGVHLTSFGLRYFERSIHRALSRYTR